MSKALHYRREGERVLSAAVDGLADDDGVIQDETITDGQITGIMVAAAYFLAAVATDQTQWLEDEDRTPAPAGPKAREYDVVDLPDEDGEPTVAIPTNDASPEPVDPLVCMLDATLTTCVRDDPDHRASVHQGWPAPAHNGVNLEPVESP